MHEFWSHCIAHFARTLNAQQLNTWIKPLSIEVTSEQILVNAPNRFVAQWVREKFLHDIRRVTNTADFFRVCEAFLDHDEPMALEPLPTLHLPPVVL